MKNNKMIIIILILLVLIFVGIFSFFAIKGEEEIKPISTEEVAKKWIEENSPTYLYDGFDLKLIDAKITNCSTCFEFTYSFLSNSAGYGDRKNQIVSQEITEHKMVIIIKKGLIEKAITDGVFSELENKMIIEEVKKITVFLYFGKTSEEDVFPVEREIVKTEGIARATINELLKGPSEEELALGYFTSINQGVIIQNLKIENGVAIIDFNDKLEENIAGSALINNIYMQIEKTLKQFDTIKNVKVSINGRTEDILQP